VIAEESAKRVAKELAKELAEAEARAEARVLQEAIIDLINDRFSTQVVTRVQQTIAPSQNIEQLKKLHRQIARVSDEEEVYALLTQFFPVREEETKEEILKGEIKGLQEAISDIVGARFPIRIYTQVQQAIAPIQNVTQLRDFLRQLACLSDEQEVSALLEQCFPIQ
jgi:hypothetical protein